MELVSTPMNANRPKRYICQGWVSGFSCLCVRVHAMRCSWLPASTSPPALVGLPPLRQVCDHISPLLQKLAHAFRCRKNRRVQLPCVRIRRFSRAAAASMARLSTHPCLPTGGNHSWKWGRRCLCASHKVVCVVPLLTQDSFGLCMKALGRGGGESTCQLDMQLLYFTCVSSTLGKIN